MSISKSEIINIVNDRYIPVTSFNSLTKEGYRHSLSSVNRLRSMEKFPLGKKLYDVFDTSFDGCYYYASYKFNEAHINKCLEDYDKNLIKQNLENIEERIKYYPNNFKQSLSNINEKKLKKYKKISTELRRAKKNKERKRRFHLKHESDIKKVTELLESKGWTVERISPIYTE